MHGRPSIDSEQGDSPSPTPSLHLLSAEPISRGCKTQTLVKRLLEFSATAGCVRLQILWARLLLDLVCPVVLSYPNQLN